MTPYLAIAWGYGIRPGPWLRGASIAKVAPASRSQSQAKRST